MIPDEATISLLCFFSPTPLGILPVFHYLTLDEPYIDIPSIIWWILLSYAVFLYVIISIILKGLHFQVGVRAAFLGLVFTTGVLAVGFLPTKFTPFGWYMCVMAFFHYSEFLTIAITNPRTLNVDSFILNHSNEYHIAAVASWIEFFIELYFLPELKMMRVVSYLGLGLCVGGECMRKLAMLTAQNNFNHVVQNVRHSDHTLVTRGVYSMCRHPSYVGWFYWSIGTQVVEMITGHGHWLKHMQRMGIFAGAVVHPHAGGCGKQETAEHLLFDCYTLAQMILVNPLCVIAYSLASWKFFNERVTVEEITLINFFGEQYLDYQEKVSTGLPLIKGYRLEE